MIPNNVSTEDSASQESQPICQRKSCPNQGKSYSEATRRCTIQTTQKTDDFPTTLSGLSFPDNRITVDLCVTCYAVVLHDKTIQMLSIVAIGPYKGIRS